MLSWLIFTCKERTKAQCLQSDNYPVKSVNTYVLSDLHLVHCIMCFSLRKQFKKMLSNSAFKVKTFALIARTDVTEYHKQGDLKKKQQQKFIVSPFPSGEVWNSTVSRAGSFWGCEGECSGPSPSFWWFLAILVVLSVQKHHPDCHFDLYPLFTRTPVILDYSCPIRVWTHFNLVHFPWTCFQKSPDSKVLGVRTLF